MATKVSLAFDVDATACNGGSHFGVTATFAGIAYRVYPIERNAPTSSEIHDALRVLVQALTSDLKDRKEVADSLDNTTVDVRPDAEVVR